MFPNYLPWHGLDSFAVVSMVEATSCFHGSLFHGFQNSASTFVHISLTGNTSSVFTNKFSVHKPRVDFSSAIVASREKKYGRKVVPRTWANEAHHVPRLTAIFFSFKSTDKVFPTIFTAALEARYA